MTAPDLGPRGRAALCFLALSIAAGTAAAEGFYTTEPGPRVTMRVARPTLVWRIFPEPGTVVRDGLMAINGTVVHPAFSTVWGALHFTPSQPLPPGEYTVQARVITSEGNRAYAREQEWSFRIAEGAVKTLPAPVAAQTEALTAANVLRRKLGLNPYKIDNRLCAAASAHCAYLQRNRADGHDEVPNSPGFTGARPHERIEAFNYPGLKTGEDVIHRLNRDIQPAEAVQGLFDAPYHREPFMDPGMEDFGAATLGGYTTLNFGTLRPVYTGPPKIILYPLSGQKDVPTTFGGGENPDPLRIHGVKPPVGFVLSFFVYAAGNVRIQVTGARLTTADGEPVRFLMNTPANDDRLTNGAFLIPRDPLKPGARYTASIQATTGGQNLSRTWSFTTREAETREAAPR